MSNSSLKIAFLGTPTIACPSLEKLIEDPRIEVLAVITQPDQKVGRKQILTAPPVKTLAEQYQVPVFQPEKLRKDQDLLKHLQTLDLDFLVVIAYGQILSKQTLDIPKTAPVNVHGSILPKYRGASPIEQALLNGDTETGISIMQMSEKMDEGAVYQTFKLPIQESDNNFSLREKMAILSAEKLPETLLKIAAGKLKAIEQNHQEATYCKKISKQDGLIKPAEQTAEQIFHQFQAYFTWPGITWNYQNKNFKLLKIAKTKENITAGQIKVGKDQLLLGTNSNALEILEIQMEGKKALPIKEFLSGNRQLFTN
ncbi:MAG: methionyl-tRNA formyltransferase [Candidatus Altimarinota bacterium]